MNFPGNTRSDNVERAERKARAANVSKEDALLVSKAKRGDKPAFELLVRKYQSRVASLIARTVHDSARVQDLTQEAFLKAYRALPKFRGDSAFYTWLYRIAVNTAKNFQLSSSRGVVLSDMEWESVDRLPSTPKETNTPEVRALQRELLGKLQKAIDSLAPTMREAIRLRELEGMTYEEIAEQMACPIGTVRSRIFRGRQEIANQMRSYMRLDAPDSDGNGDSAQGRSVSRKDRQLN